MRDYLIAPSILAADFARLGQDVEAVLDAGADIVHFDVMDNHYVPNLTIGPMVCSALRDYGISAPIDVHLMVQPVDALVGMFADAGASFITFIRMHQPMLIEPYSSSEMRVANRAWYSIRHQAWMRSSMCSIRST